MEAKFSKIFSNINLNLNIVETRRFISDLRKDMQIYTSSPDRRLLSALNGDILSQRAFIAVVNLGRGMLPCYDFYDKWITDTWDKYRV